MLQIDVVSTGVEELGCERRVRVCVLILQILSLEQTRPRRWAEVAEVSRSEQTLAKVSRMHSCYDTLVVL